MSQKFKNPVEVDGQVSAEYLDLSTTTSHSVNAGEIAWNSVDGTFDIGLLNGVILQAGQEMHFYGKATEAISNGNAVMFVGVQGDHILIAKADAATINANPEYFMGVATQDFATNDFGYVTAFGNVRGIDTSAYSLGDILYYDSTTSTDGLLTPTMPQAPNAKIIVAAVVKVHAIQGILAVRPHTMPKLKDIQDVNVDTATTGEILQLQSDGVWENKTLSEAGIQSLTQSFTNVVYFNSTNPSTATIFDLNNPPVINDNSLKNDVSNLYIGTDASTWVYKTSPAGYVTYVQPSSTPFFINGTTIDAGSNKTSIIYRNADVISNGVRIGRGSGNISTNTLIGGGGALSANTTGDNNVALGEYALGSNTTGTSNFGMGFASLGANTTGSFNVGLGRASLRWSTGNYNVGIGMQALSANGMTGSNNIGIGWLAGGSTTGNSNVSLGTNSGGQTTGSRNITIGVDAKVVTATSDGQVNIGNSLFATGATSNSNASPLGNWGVGVSNPSERLHVNGRLRLATIDNGAGNFATISGTGVITRRTASEVLSDIGAQPILTNPITGTGTTNYLPKFTGSGTLGNSLIFDNGTNVLIGNTASNTSNVMQIQTTGSSRLLSLFNTTSQGGAKIEFFDGTSNGAIGNLGSNLIFYINSRDTERMRLNANGLGIGTTSPSARLHVYSASSDSLSTIARFSSLNLAGNDEARLEIQADPINNIVNLVSTGTNIGNMAFFSSGNEVMRFNTSRNVGIGTTAPEARLDVRAQGALSTDIAFRVRNSADNNDLIRVQGDGNVGIGTTAPTERFQVSGNAIINDLLIARRNNVLTGNANGVIFQTDGTAGGIRPAEGSHLVLQARSNADRDIIMVTGATPTERMTIKGNGNVGIGFTSPTYRLQVNDIIATVTGFGNFTALQAIGGAGYRWSLNNDSTFRLNRTTNGFSSVTTPIMVDSSDRVGIATTSMVRDFQVGAFSGSPEICIASSTTGNGALVFGDGATGNDPWRGYVQYQHSTDSMTFGTANGERLRITSGGAMGLGITNPTNTAGRFEASNDIVAYSSSDKNWKKNIKNINSPLEKLSQINGVEFDWIEDEPVHGNKGHDIGVIAQEIEQVLPEIVQTRESGMKAVQYDKIIPLLIESIKEQQKQIDELKQIINGFTK